MRVTQTLDVNVPGILRAVAYRATQTKTLMSAITVDTEYLKGLLKHHKDFPKKVPLAPHSDRVWTY